MVAPAAPRRRHTARASQEVRVRIKGRPKKITLPYYMTLNQARAEAARIYAKVNGLRREHSDANGRRRRYTTSQHWWSEAKL
jgi:hypothetical protein